MATRSSSSRFDALDSVALLALVRDGDNDAYGELYQRYHDFAHRVARRSSRRHADDLVAEAFRRVLTAISRGAGPTQAFGPYLATTIRSAAAGLAAPYQEVELTVSNELVDDRGDIDPRVSTAYLSLPEAWQNALWYSEVERMSPRHAAPLMGLASANAFSALRKRARAGLRSAYLTQVVDDACNEEVRRHLELLAAGKTTPEVVDALVDEHLGECDQCGAVAWRIAAVTGSKVPMALAPAMVAFLGFEAAPALLPAGLGQVGLLGWWRRNSQAAGAAVAAVAVLVLLLAGLMYVAGRSGGDDATTDAGPPTAVGGDEDSGSGSGSGSGSDDGTGDGEGRDDGGEAGSDGVVPVTTPESTSTTTSTSSTTTTSTTTSTSSTTTTSTTTSTSSTTTTTTSSTTTTPTTTTPTTTTTPPPTTPPPTTPPPTTPPPTTPPPTTPPPTTPPPTTVPAVPPGDLVIFQDVISGSFRHIDLAVQRLTGDGGTIRFSQPFLVVTSDNLVCDATVCAFGPVSAPLEVTAHIDTEADPITIELLDASNVVVESYTSP